MVWSTRVNDSISGNDKDELFDEAVRLIKLEGKASTVRKGAAEGG